MLQEIQQTEQERLDMYMKLSKKELALMLISASNTIDMLASLNTLQPTYPTYPNYPHLPVNPSYTITIGNEIN